MFHFNFIKGRWATLFTYDGWISNGQVAIDTKLAPERSWAVGGSFAPVDDGIAVDPAKRYPPNGIKSFLSVIDRMYEDASPVGEGFIKGLRNLDAPDNTGATACLVSRAGLVNVQVWAFIKAHCHVARISVRHKLIFGVTNLWAPVIVSVVFDE